MAKSSSTDAADKDGGGEAAAPYGTRSRNRTGSSRPNYAEDRDYDVEMYDFDHDKAQGDTRKGSRQAGAANHVDGTRGTAGSRKPLGDDARTGPSQNGSKEHTPAAAAASSNASQSSNGVAAQQQPSRKRKAATASQQAASGAAPASTRRAGASTQNNATVSSWPNTNVLTFSNCGARPQNGRLVADDGTELEANGTW